MGAQMATPAVQFAVDAAFVGAAAAAIAGEPAGTAKIIATPVAPTKDPDALDALLSRQDVWRAGRAPIAVPRGEPTGHDELDALLPQSGWPCDALTELLLPCDGVGEIALLLPTLARLTQAGGIVALVAPPYVPYAPAWQAASVDLRQLQVVEADARGALWAFEQCLRSGACAAVLGWPSQADAQALRRLQVAAASGECLGFAFRDRRHAANPSPAALRLECVRGHACEGAWHVRKCRGGNAPAQAFVPVGAVGAVMPFAQSIVLPAFAASAAPTRKGIAPAGTIVPATATATAFARHPATPFSMEGNCRPADALAG